MIQKLKQILIHSRLIASAMVVLLVGLSIPQMIKPGIDDTNQSQGVLGANTEVQTRGEQAENSYAEPPSLNKPLALNQIRAKSFLVYDQATGAILAEKDATLQLPIASLTKLMTAFAVYKSLGLEGQVIVTNKDKVNTSPVLGLTPGDTVSIEDLFIAMLVGSENDAALALANHTEKTVGTKFTTIMNDEAKQLSMNDTNFNNPLGFDSVYNFSTARDLKNLVDATQKLSAFSLYNRQLNHSFQGQFGKSYGSKATNKLIAKDPEIFAIKTGYTDGAGGSMIIKAVRDTHAVVLIVLGSPNREADTQRLKEAIFESFDWK